MRLNGKVLKLTALLYMYIPVMIFMAGYTKWYYALVAGAVIIVCVYAYVADRNIIGRKNTDVMYDIDAFMDEEEVEDIKLHPVALLTAVVLITSVCILVGIGGLFPQAGDWYKHNAVLRDLTNSSWPVYYDRYDDCMLTYYLGQYLVPAVIGKIFSSFEVSNIAMSVWSIGGLILVYLMLLRVTKADSLRKQIPAVLIMLFFCGGLNLAQNILKEIYNDRMYSLGSYHWILVDGIMLQYRSNLVMIRWVLPQIIVPWLATMLFIEDIKRIEYYVVILLPSLLFGSFSFAALAVIAFVNAMILLIKKESRLKKLLSLYNILPGICPGIVLFFYFLGNIQVEKPISSSFRFQTYGGDHFTVYIVFCIFMFGIYCICVGKENLKTPLFYINTGILLALPWLRMGLCNDVVMSGSIPSLFILMIYVMRLLFDERESTSLGIRKGIAIVIMLIGCIYPVKEIADNIIWNNPGSELADSYPTMKWFTKRGDPNTSEDLMYNYYTYDMDGKTFYEYIARVKH